MALRRLLRRCWVAVNSTYRKSYRQFLPPTCHGDQVGVKSSVFREGARVLVFVQSYILCTGAISFYAPFILLLISNLFCTKGERGEGGRESPTPLPLPPPQGRSEFTLSLWGRRGEGSRALPPPFTSLALCTEQVRKGGGGPLDGVGPENHIKLTTYSTEYRIQNTPAAKLMYIKLPMYLFFIWRDFEGPPFPMTLEMDFPH